MTTLTRPLGNTQTRQLLTFPSTGYAPTVTAYLWGAGGGAGGSDGQNPGGAGSGGGYVRAEFTAVPGQTIEVTVGSAGNSGVNSTPANVFLTPIFNTRTAVPNSPGSTTALPRASNTYVVKWSKFLNDSGVWNTGTAINGSTTNLANTLTFDQSYTVWFQYSIDYVFALAAFYQATVYLDGEVFIESGLDSWTNQVTTGVQFVRTITPGQHTIRITATANPGATYGTFGVGLTIAAAGNAGLGGGGLVRQIFDSRTTVASPPLYTPVAPAAASFQTYSNLIVDHGVWEYDIKASSCSRTYNNIYFPHNGTYQLQLAAANSATVSIDGTVVATTPGTDSYATAYVTDVNVSQGYHTLSFTASFTDTALPAAGIALVISKSWSGATGGLAGPQGSSGGGGGSGGCTTLVLNPQTTAETLLAVAVGGAGGGGAGNSTTGRSESNAPGPRGRTAGGISSGQVGQDQGDFYKDGGGGGAGGPGGPDGAGNNGYSSVGDSYAQAGSVGVSYRNTSATIGGVVIDPTGIASAGANSQYYSLVGSAGTGASAGQLQARHGAAVIVFDAYGTQVRDDAVDGAWHDVKNAFVYVNGTWRQTTATYVYLNNSWQMLIGGAALNFTGQADGFGRLSRPSDHRAIPPPPPKVYDSVRIGCFVAGTQITMADGSHKANENVSIGETVLGKDGVSNTVVAYVRPVLGDRTLVSINGSSAFMTNDHPVYCKDGEWKSANPDATRAKYELFQDWTIGKLSVGDVIETADGAGIAINTISEHAEDPDTQLYNFILDGNHTYVANNMIVHNKNSGGVGVGSAGSSAGNGSGASSAGGSSAGSAYSDGRLKHRIELIQTRDDGLKIYAFSYVWSDVRWVGVMAQDLLQQPQFAHAVKLEANGFYSVDYSKINFEMIMADQCVCLD